MISMARKRSIWVETATREVCLRLYEMSFKVVLKDGCRAQ